MQKIQGDEENINRLYFYLIANFPRIHSKIKIPLRKLVPEPKSSYYKSIWRYGHGDVVIYRHNKLACIIELDGMAHFTNSEQIGRDQRKDKLCKMNGINVLRVGNCIISHLDSSKTRKLLKKYIYGEVR